MNFYRTFFVLLTACISTSVTATEPRSDAVRYLDLEVSNLVLTSRTDSGKVVYAEPGEQISGNADCVSYRTTYPSDFNQMIVGFDGIGAQDGIGNGPFVLVAPNVPGIYEVRFRHAQAFSLEEAVKRWWWVDGAPKAQATIGLVIVTEYPEQATRLVNDSNWKEWLQEQYSANKHFADDVITYSALTNQQVLEKDFWDKKKTQGQWDLHKNSISNNGTLHHNEYNQLVSQNAFHRFFLQVTEKYKHTKNNATDWWSHSRGFGILYYMTDDLNVEFRYFPDVGQLSLYIRDEKKYVEEVKNAYFPPNSNIVHDIIVDKGRIIWLVNDEVVFEETTSLQYGYLMLTNHNNAVSFKF